MSEDREIEVQRLARVLGTDAGDLRGRLDGAAPEDLRALRAATPPNEILADVETPTHT